MEGNDRREHARLSMAVAVDFNSSHNFYSAQTRDISTGGLFVETDAGLPIGTRLGVDLKFSKSQLRVNCEVMWALTEGDKTVGVGLRFVDLRPSAKKSIEAFMVLRKPLAAGETVLDEDGEVEAEGEPLGGVPPPLPESTRTPG
jgi:uncharacterized protein (TIGR02266 family)